MDLVKKKRLRNLKLIKELKEHSCVTCFKKGPNDVHHITTRGAGGDDIPSNLITLCRQCHIKLHQYGLKKFAWKYPKFKEFLTKFNRIDILNKLSR